MIQQTIHEFINPPAVATPLGSGVALLMFGGSYLSNTCWVVKLDGTGEVKHFDSNDIRIYGSPTYGEVLEPELPECWRSKYKKTKL